jgi:hypothetical protein
MKKAKAISHISPLLIVVFFLFTAVGRAQSIPREVQTALEKYAFLSPISFDWEGTLTANTVRQSDKFSVTSSYSREGQSFSWMHEIQRKDANYPPFKRTCRFDGDVLSEANGKVQALWYRTARLIKGQPKARHFDVPYFEAVGIYCPTRMNELPRGALQSNILRLIQNGAKLVSCENTRLEQEAVVRIEIIAENPAWEDFLKDNDNLTRHERARLRNKEISQREFDELVKTSENSGKAIPQSLRWVYYLSPKNGYAVCKHQRLAMDGKVVVSYSNDAFRPIPGTQIVLAGKVEISSFEQFGLQAGSRHYELLSTPSFTRDLSVVKVSTKSIPKEQFVLNMKEVVPGALIIDFVTPGLQRKDGSVITFNMPASPDDLDAAIAAATRKSRQATTPVVDTSAKGQQ